MNTFLLIWFSQGITSIFCEMEDILHRGSSPGFMKRVCTLNFVACRLVFIVLWKRLYCIASAYQCLSVPSTFPPNWRVRPIVPFWCFCTGLCYHCLTGTHEFPNCSVPTIGWVDSFQLSQSFQLDGLLMKLLFRSDDNLMQYMIAGLNDLCCN